MISSNWNKNDRFNSSFIYGIIAYQVFTLVQNNLSGTIEYDELLQIKDVTGLASLVVQIIEVFLIGLSIIYLSLKYIIQKLQFKNFYS